MNQTDFFSSRIGKEGVYLDLPLPYTISSGIFLLIITCMEQLDLVILLVIELKKAETYCKRSVAEFGWQKLRGRRINVFSKINH